MASTAVASPVVWQTPVTETGTTADFITSGTLVDSAKAGMTLTAGGVLFNGANTPVGNSISFSGGSNITVAPVTVDYAVYGSAPPSWDAAYAKLVGAGAYKSGMDCS